MEGKTFYSLIAIIILLLLFFSYWFIPYNTTEFNASPNSNFSLNNSENNSLQFYSNMRFSETNLSYRIEDCPLQRTNDMSWAFNIISDTTILNFFPVEDRQEITITCDDANKFEGNLFIAGEGGPTNITVAGKFNIIESGKILLIKDSDCERPNVALHELLHVLGFDHSKNPKNIMYEISRCDQTMGEDIIDFINEIYSIPSQPDLLFENTSVLMHGKYLDINFSIRNNGIKDSEESVVKIIADGKEVKEIEIPKIEIGYGREIYITNIWIRQINVQNIEFIIENNFDELSKTNNQVMFEIKK
ncbi:MAG: CARDB domain-containing protein [Nanoarchaeota archaeon]